MARGADAKNVVVNKIAAAFGEDYIGEYDKKYYVWAYENGERIQIAISLTCPKNPIEVANNIVDNDKDWDWGESKSKATTIAITNAAPAEITETEVQNLQEMMAKLGL